MDYIYGIAAFVTLTIILTLVSIRKRNASWQGKVTKLKTYSVDRNRSDDGPSDFEDWITVYYQTDSGKKGKYDFPKRGFDDIYPDLKVGDRLLKNKGEYYPSKVTDGM